MNIFSKFTLEEFNKKWGLQIFCLILNVATSTIATTELYVPDE